MLIPLKYMIRKYRMNVTGIMHVGAHLAEELADYTEQGIYNVVWVEADPLTYEKLLEIVPPHQYAVQAVVSDQIGQKLTFNRANNGQSSSILELGTHETEHPEVVYTDSFDVVTATIDDLAWELEPKRAIMNMSPRTKKAYGVKESPRERPKNPVDYINMLNLDIQGAELKALQGAEDVLGRIRYIYTEVNEKELYKGCALLPELDSFLAEHDFKRVETSMTPHGWGDALYVKS